ncbi:MAG: penicillin-binding transpeptidase domain-containing protein [Bacteroidota bacterium]
MKYLPLFLILFLSCTNKDLSENKKNLIPEKTQPERIVSSHLQAIVDSAELNGSILIFDPQKQIYFSNDFEWAEIGHLPASTFKIPNSMIFLESGVIANDSALIKWDGKKRDFKMWERDFIFRDAFKYSCLPCYQEITRRLGYAKMKEFTSKLNYGNLVFDSTDFDAFWVAGESTISQFQQIDFLQRFYQHQLPISERTDKMVRDIFIMEKSDDYTLSGKTGWSFSEGQNDNGWFVGYLQKKDGLFYFATNIEPTERFDMNSFIKIRKAITMDALRHLKIIG